jgi:hypothetical protein
LNFETKQVLPTKLVLPTEEREKTAEAHGSKAHFWNVQAFHEPAGASSKSQTPNPKKAPIANFQMASSPRPSPPVEEREKNMAVQGHSACAQRNEALHEPSNKHAAPTELEKGPVCVGGYRHGAPMELFKMVHCGADVAKKWGQKDIGSEPYLIG